MPLQLSAQLEMPPGHGAPLYDAIIDVPDIVYLRKNRSPDILKIESGSAREITDRIARQSACIHRFNSAGKGMAVLNVPVFEKNRA